MKNSLTKTLKEQLVIAKKEQLDYETSYWPIQ